MAKGKVTKRFIEALSPAPEREKEEDLGVGKALKPAVQKTSEEAGDEPEEVLRKYRQKTYSQANAAKAQADKNEAAGRKNADQAYLKSKYSDDELKAHKAKGDEMVAKLDAKRKGQLKEAGKGALILALAHMNSKDIGGNYRYRGQAKAMARKR